MPKSEVVDMTGQQFGWLTAIDRAPTPPGARKNAYWRCVCTCGQQVNVSGQMLRRGKRKACGVNHHVWAAQPRGGLIRQHPNEYISYKHMHDRCRNKKHHRYKNYGKRGIKICARWYDFKNFLDDMGKRPENHTLDRIDNDGNYEPSNCQWATWDEQRRNQSRSVFVEYKGEKLLLIDLCARLGVSRSIMYGRLRNGWPLEHALFTPVNHYKKGKTK
jgi:hypothetical protein